MPAHESMSEVVKSLRKELRDQRAAIRELHDRKLAGPRVSAKLAALADVVVQRLFEATMAQLPPDRADALRFDIALVGLGSHARRQCSPYSDVDLMILHRNHKQADVAEQLRPLTQGIFDVGLQLGHSVRTPTEAVRLARSDAVICTSLIDGRLLLGSRDLFELFRTGFDTMVRKNSKNLCRDFLESRAKERDQYGETVYLLEPHVKRSRGGIRDMNLLRWLSFAEHGISDPERLYHAGALSKLDYRRLHSATEFLLRLRNEMHFHAESAQDLLNRAEQLRVADWLGHTHRAGLLPVEHFMRDYFRHTKHIWQLVRRRASSLQEVSTMKRVLDPVLSRKVDDHFRVGITYVSATPAGLNSLKSDMSEVLTIVALSASEGKHLDHSTWTALLLAAPDFLEDSQDSSWQEVREQFYHMLADTATVAEVLRVLHELGYLEKVIPAMKHARCLLQFNQYHKYTVDEHCLRAVRKAAEFNKREDTLGQAYREISDKRVLHLALLLHDLGKGFEEDHSEVGKRIAEETCALLKLEAQTAEDVAFLVHKHLVMSHLTFRRDTSDERLIQGFANDVGSVERLRMLFVLTCADLAAVGPGVLNDWKVDLLADVFARSVTCLQASGEVHPENKLETYRKNVLSALSESEGEDPWFVRQVEKLPASFLASCEVDSAVAALRRFHTLSDHKPVAWCVYMPETKTLEFIAGVSQGAGRGVFSSMAGALSSAGMQIHAAGTDLLADGLLMLHYTATDPAHPQGTPEERQIALCRALVAAVDSETAPKFPTVWGAKQAEASIQLSALPDEVRIDTQLSADYTIVEVFTFDRPALLYQLARKLHDLELVISHAKIGTYLDQVVDVFYVTDRDQQKVLDAERLQAIRHELLEVIERKK